MSIDRIVRWEPGFLHQMGTFALASRAIIVLFSNPSIRFYRTHSNLVPFFMAFNCTHWHGLSAFVAFLNQHARVFSFLHRYVSIHKLCRGNCSTFGEAVSKNVDPQCVDWLNCRGVYEVVVPISFQSWQHRFLTVHIVYLVCHFRLFRFIQRRIKPHDLCP